MELAFEQIELSVGDLEGAVFKAFRDGYTMEIEWVSEGGEVGDKVMVGVYDEEATEEVVVLEAGKRGAGRTHVTLPERWGKDERLHVYVAFVSKEGKTSRSEHVMPTEHGRH